MYSFLASLEDELPIKETRKMSTPKYPFQQNILFRDYERKYKNQNKSKILTKVELRCNKFHEIFKKIRAKDAAKEIIAEESMASAVIKTKRQSKRERYHENMKGDKRHSVGMTFEDKENFLEQACRKAAEAAEHPMLVRNSISYKTGLERISFLKWNDMSQKCKNKELENEDNEENEEDLFNFEMRRLRKVLNDSILSNAANASSFLKKDSEDPLNQQRES